MIQIVFTDNGKVHTVTFSGDEAKKWSSMFINLLVRNGITWEERII